MCGTVSTHVKHVETRIVLQEPWEEDWWDEDWWEEDWWEED